MTRAQDPFDFSDPEPRRERPRAGGGPVSDEVKCWIAAAHLGPLAYYLLWWIPGSSVALVIPVAILRFRAGLDPRLADQAREAFNFHLCLAAAVGALSLTLFVTLLVPVLVVLAGVALAIIACRRACEGERYRYPWIWRLLPNGDAQAPSGSTNSQAMYTA